MTTQTIELTQCQGYLWMSNDPMPKPIEGDYKLQLDPTSNPFVIEAQLCNADVSYSVKYVDGRYHVIRWDLNQDLGEDFEYTLKEFASHNRLGKELRLLFRQYWKAVPDAQCEGMKALRPHALVFVGFKKKEDKQ